MEAIYVRSQIRRLTMYVGVFVLIGISAAAQVMEVHSFLSLNEPVPDGSASGIGDTRNIDSSLTELTGVRLRLKIAGEFNGDLYGYLRQITSDSTNFAVVLNRPGVTDNDRHGYAGSGLDLWIDDLAVSGDIHSYQSVTVPAPETPLSGTWAPDGRNADPDAVTETSPRNATFTKFLGQPATGEWTLFLADLESGGTNVLAAWELEFIGKKTPTVDWPAPAPIVYGTPLGDSELNASSLIEGTFDYNPAIGELVAAGNDQTLSVTFTPNNTDDYLPHTKQVTINVLKKVLAVTADDHTRVYGSPDPEFTVAYAGFIPGEDESFLSTTASATSAAMVMSDVGSYTITPAGASSPNYEMSYVNGTLSITKASLTATVTSSLNPALPGDSVSLTATLSPVPPATGFPGGTGQFLDEASPLGTAVALTGGTAVLYTDSLSHGRHAIQFDYAGDGNFFAASANSGLVQLINTPPVASDDSVERFADADAFVSINTLLSNDSDADADTVSFLSFENGTSNGGTILREGDWLHYTPSAGHTNADSFNYTIEDAFGATDTATINVGIEIGPIPSPHLTIEELAGDEIRIRFNGVPGITYSIQYSDQMPAALWNDLGNATADQFGLLLFTNMPPENVSERFFRSAHP